MASLVGLRLDFIAHVVLTKFYSPSSIPSATLRLSTTRLAPVFAGATKSSAVLRRTEYTLDVFEIIVQPWTRNQTNSHRILSRPAIDVGLRIDQYRVSLP